MKWDSTRLSSKKTALSGGDFCAAHSASSWGIVLGNEYMRSGVWEIIVETTEVDNPSLFLGVAAPEYWSEVEAAAADEEAEDALPRDSKHCICMHGDGRCFIKGIEKDWGMQRLASGSTLVIILDFEAAQVTFRLSRAVRGRTKETVAEIPGLGSFQSASLVACFGGRDQQLTVASCRRLEGGGSDQTKVRDVFADAEAEKGKIEAVAFDAPSKSMTYEEQLRAVAVTTEGSN